MTLGNIILGLYTDYIRSFFWVLVKGLLGFLQGVLTLGRRRSWLSFEALSLRGWNSLVIYGILPKSGALNRPQVVGLLLQGHPQNGPPPQSHRNGRIEFESSIRSQASGQLIACGAVRNLRAIKPQGLKGLPTGSRYLMKDLGPKSHENHGL